MSAAEWWRRVGADLARSAPQESAWRARAARVPETVPGPKPKVFYVVAVWRNGLPFPVESVTEDKKQARRDADWWASGHGAAAFVAELREAPQ